MERTGNVCYAFWEVSPGFNDRWKLVKKLAEIMRYTPSTFDHSQSHSRKEIRKLRYS